MSPPMGLTWGGELRTDSKHTAHEAALTSESRLQPPALFQGSWLDHQLLCTPAPDRPCPQVAAAFLLKEERRSFVPPPPGLCTLGFPSLKSFSQKSTSFPTRLSTFSEVVPPNQTFCLLCFILTLTKWIYLYVSLESVS